MAITGPWGYDITYHHDSAPTGPWDYDITFSEWTRIATLEANVTTFDDNTATAGVTYQYRVASHTGGVAGTWALSETVSIPVFGGVKFYDGTDTIIDSSNQLDVITLDASLTITAKADTGYVAPSVTVVSSDAAVRLSTNGTTWASSITLTNVDETGVDFYVKQTAKLLYGIDAHLVAQIG